MNAIKKLAGQTVVYGLSSILGRLLNYLLVPLHTYVFATEEYGVVTELYAYVAFIFVLLTFGLETGFFRFARKTNNARKVYSTVLIPLGLASILFVFLIMFFAENIAQIIDYKHHTEYIIWFAAIIGLDAFSSLPFAKLRHESRAMRFVSIKMLNIGLTVILNLFFLLFCPYWLDLHPDTVLNAIYSPDVRVGYVFIANLAGSGITVLLLLPEILRIQPRIDSRLLKQILLYSLPLVLAGLAGIVNETLDRILLKFLLVIPDNQPDSYVMSQLGIYGANYKISILMTLFIQAFRYAAEPFFFAQAKNKKSKKLYADVMKYFVLFGLFVFLSINFYIDFVKYFIDPKFHEGLQIVPILLLANLFLGVIYNLSFWYKLTDKTKFAVLIALSGAAVTLALNFLLIPKMGYMGSAWATFFCYLSMMLISYLLGRKHFMIPYELKNLAIYFALALSLYGISELVALPDLWGRIALNTVLLLLFLAFVIKKEKWLSKFIKHNLL